MSAARLREAAKVLRDRAGGTIPGPWVVAQHGNGFPPMVLNDAENMPVAETFDKPRLEDATYIATMHPGVGLALADWLDIEASRNPEQPIGDGITIGGPLLQALAVADAILGGAS